MIGRYDVVELDFGIKVNYVSCYGACLFFEVQKSFSQIRDNQQPFDSSHN